MIPGVGAVQVAKPDSRFDPRHVRRQTDAARSAQIRPRLLAERGDAPGLVHIFSAMESCSSYRPWHDKTSGKTFFKPITGKCLHYYFYFIDEQFGLCYLRVPTWAPFRLQFYFNGHNLLAAKLREAGIGFTLADNAFLEIEDFSRAQELADQWVIGALHRQLNRWAQIYCPVIRHFHSGYHWSLMQVEYATDIVFKRQSDLGPLYELLSRTAIHTVKPRDVATFLGRKLRGNFEGEIGNDFHTRIEGTRIKHHMGRVSIKMYDKAGSVLRVETVINQPEAFKVRKRVRRKGVRVTQWVPMRKGVANLFRYRDVSLAANGRYLEALAVVDDPSAALKQLNQITRKNLINLREKLQAAIDEISASGRCDRIIIGYGICGRGTVGIQSRDIPLAIPKVHDCIAFFLGGDAAYRREFKKYPGTYYISGGWYEEKTEPISQQKQSAYYGSEKLNYKELAEKYGGWDFRTKHQLGVKLLTWFMQSIRALGLEVKVWLVVDGAYAARPFLLPVLDMGIVVVSRLRKDACLFDLPPAGSHGNRIYGHNKISLAKRAGHHQGWQTITYRRRGVEVTCQYKTFLATSRLVSGQIRVVIVRFEDGSWAPYFCTDTSAEVRDILEAVAARWAIEEHFHDVKEIWGAGQQQVRNVWSNIGCWHLNQWVYTLVELCCWDTDKSELTDRQARSWDNADRRPSHADRRRSISREMLQENFLTALPPTPNNRKFRRLFEALLDLAI